MRLKDRVAVVAGGSDGIGKATAQLLAREGAKVVVVARTQPRLEEAVREVRKHGEALAVQADVQREQDVQRVFDTAIHTYGRVDILAAVAGYGGAVVKPVAELSLAEWNEIFAGNMVNTFLCCREALKHMIPARRGSIVTFSSSAGATGNVNRSAYSAAKAGVVAFTRALAREVGPYNIRVNCISPVAATEKLRTGLSAQAKRMGVSLETVERSIVSGNALGRMPTPEEVAYGVLYLVSNDSSALTGQTIDINCGSTMR
jgi:NAD(P)-dependent dehydrogenase (short-subunit alcohol dehydrogenase family)